MADKLISADKLAQNFQRKTWYSSDEVLDTISDAQGVEAESMYAVYESWDNCEEDYEDYEGILYITNTREQACKAIEKRRNDLMDRELESYERNKPFADHPQFGEIEHINPSLNAIDTLTIKTDTSYNRMNRYYWTIKEIELDIFLF